MKEQLPEQFSSDAIGLYNETVYQRTGEKFRPIDIHYGQLVILTPGIVHHITERRNSVRQGPQNNSRT